MMLLVMLLSSEGRHRGSRARSYQSLLPGLYGAIGQELYLRGDSHRAAAARSVAERTMQERPSGSLMRFRRLDDPMSEGGDDVGSANRVRSSRTCRHIQPSSVFPPLRCTRPRGRTQLAPILPLEVVQITHIASPTMSSLWPKAATPDVLPEPTLTDLELRAAAEDAQAHLDAEQDEMDVKNAGSSWEGPDQDDSESSKGVPSADHAIQAAFADAHGSASQHVQEHPLRMDVHPPSPTPWEVTGPPPGEVGAQRTFTRRRSRDGARVHQQWQAQVSVLACCCVLAPPKRSVLTVCVLACSVVGAQPHTPAGAPLRVLLWPPPADSAYGTDPIGQIGVHHPREIVRIERDYTGGELVQFAPSYPLELEGRVTPTQFLETINAINELLISAHSLRHSFFDNALSFFHAPGLEAG
ncbi:hypothetical protein A0H81_00166 [Grifola frondosa]|uniref:Ras modification protein ERF4 n=1 Tax=Grifola frondosa TaxID=5627 RepID=A0A1C7MT73_GRIFR|nr:hypothetical protein A0H81_00166 [Grifola frondosa]